MGGQDRGARRGRKALRVTLIVLGAVPVAALASFVPALSARAGDMTRLAGTYVDVYYQTEEAAARDVFALAEAAGERIAGSLGFAGPQDVAVYVYDRQSTFQTKKYGYLALLLDLDWYIGDNRGTDVLLTSPANPGPAHDHAGVRDAVAHEMVHAYTSLPDADLPPWIDEGPALHLSNGDPPRDLYRTSPVPTVGQMRTANPVEFADIGGYDFAHTYIEYLDAAFGWPSVLAYVRTSDAVAVFGVDEDELHAGWTEFLAENYG